jgi:adhesin transport system outer membrane protein
MIGHLLVMALAAAGQSHAEVPGGCIGLEQAVTLATSGDPRIGRADAAFDRARAQVRIERAAGRPQLSAFARSGIGDGDGVQADNEFDNRLGLRLSQRLYSFGRTGLAVGAAELRAAGEREGIRAARLQVAGEAGERFLLIARGLEKVKAAEAMIAYYAKDAEQVGRRLDAGLLKRSEASGILAEAARARARAAEERLRVEQERTALETLIGVAAPCVVPDAGEAFLRIRQPPALQAALSEAEARSPAIAARTAEAAAAQLDRKREGRGGLPDIGVSGTSALDFNRDRGIERVSRFGLDVTAPIFQGGQIGGRRDAASAQARLIGYEVQVEKRTVANDVTIAWTRTRDLAPIAELNRQTVAALGDQAVAVEREYEAGLVTLTDLIEVRRNEYTGRLAEIDARYDLLLERLRLLRLTARLLEGE